jgi:hypothetical protein
MIVIQTTTAIYLPTLGLGAPDPAYTLVRVIALPVGFTAPSAPARILRCDGPRVLSETQYLSILIGNINKNGRK